MDEEYTKDNSLKIAGTYGTTHIFTCNVTKVLSDLRDSIVFDCWGKPHSFKGNLDKIMEGHPKAGFYIPTRGVLISAHFISEIEIDDFDNRIITLKDTSFSRVSDRNNSDARRENKILKHLSWSGYILDFDKVGNLPTSI